jgi:hypothetical protein|tara:strand:+ start:13693 stop:14073 length:381 start_codon:yes stop_codon:yes gene_type:complete
MGNFDIDLNFGQIYEEKIRELFEGEGSIEVKTERDIWADTGNIAIEIRSRGKPSGLSTTEAKWWIQVFTVDGDVKFMLMFRVDNLRKAVKYLYINELAPKINGGDDNTSELILVPISTLLLLNKKF